MKDEVMEYCDDVNQRLLNTYEEVTYDALQRVCATSGARVFPKVRVADVFQLEGSKITSAEFSYGLRAHFDFLVTTDNYLPLFSVEFDGPLHKSSETQKTRDRLKNQLCDHFNHGLLRINSNYLSKQYRGLDLLTYFVDAWFLEQAFSEAQRDGTIPEDEIFDIALVASNGIEGTRIWPYWLSLDVQLALQKLYKSGRIGQFASSYYVGTDNEDNYRCLCWLVLDDQHMLAVTTGMRAQRFPPVWESDLIHMLAQFDLYARVRQTLNGDQTSIITQRDFFGTSLPRFQGKYDMVSSGSVGVGMEPP